MSREPVSPQRNHEESERKLSVNPVDGTDDEMGDEQGELGEA